MAACRDGSASTANTISADALIVVVALTVSSVMVTALRSAGFLTALRGEVLSVPHDVDDAAKQDSLVGSRAWPSEPCCPCRSAFDDAFSPAVCRHRRLRGSPTRA